MFNGLFFLIVILTLSYILSNKLERFGIECLSYFLKKSGGGILFCLIASFIFRDVSGIIGLSISAIEFKFPMPFAKFALYISLNFSIVKSLSSKELMWRA